MHAGNKQLSWSEITASWPPVRWGLAMVGRLGLNLLKEAGWTYGCTGTSERFTEDGDCLEMQFVVGDAVRGFAMADREHNSCKRASCRSTGSLRPSCCRNTVLSSKLQRHCSLVREAHHRNHTREKDKRKRPIDTDLFLLTFHLFVRFSFLFVVFRTSFFRTLFF